MRREYPEAPVVGVGAVVIDAGMVLLVRRGREPLKGEWSLPGGALEIGETLEQGVAREVLEETGLKVVPEALVEVLDRIVRDEPGGAVRYHYVLVDFLCRPALPRQERLICASDAAEARWVAREEAGSEGAYRVAPFTVQVIEKAFRMHQAAAQTSGPGGPFHT